MATAVIDLANQMVVGRSLVVTAAASTTAYNGGAVDMQLTDGPVFGVLSSGTVTGTALNLVCKLQEGDDTTTFTDLVSGGVWSTTYNETTADDLAVIVNGRRTKRYVRAVAAITGTAVTSVPISLVVMGQKKILGGSGTVTT